MAILDLQNGANITVEFSSGPLDGGQPVGSSNTLQYNNSGVWGSIPTATYTSGNLRLGSNTNVQLTGGLPGQFLVTDGAGNLSWSNGNSAGTVTNPGGISTSIQYNDSGTFNGISTVTYNGTNISLGPINTVKLSGGNVGDIVRTDGTGNISYVHPGNTIVQPSMQWLVNSNGNNQTFSNDFLFTFPSNVYATVFKNGTLMDAAEYIITGNNITINRVLKSNDVITVAATGILGGTSSGGLANINLNGNVLTYLTGLGTWEPFGGALISFDQIIANTIDVGNINISNIANISNANITNSFIANSNISNANITNGNIFDLVVSNTANLGSVANITILGGNPNDALTTDGSGTLSWSTLSNINSVSLNGNSLTYLNGSGVWSPSFTGNIGNVNLNGNSLTYLNGSGVWSPSFTGNIGNTNLNGNGSTYLLGNGIWSPLIPAGSNTQIQFNNNGLFGSDSGLTYNITNDVLTVANITSTKGISNLSFGVESYLNSAVTGGTVNIDLLTNSTLYFTSNAASNYIVNIRGDAGTTLNSLLNLYQSVIVTAYIPMGSVTSYEITGLQIDGVNQTINWVNGFTPSTVTNTTSVYSFQIIKTSATPTYKVFGQMSYY